MAKVSLLPITPDLAGTARQLAQLKRAIDDRAELGSRALHINTLSCDLEQQLHTLQEEVAYLTANSAIPEATLCQIGTFIQLVRQTITAATKIIIAPEGVRTTLVWPIGAATEPGTGYAKSY